MGEYSFTALVDSETAIALQSSLLLTKKLEPVSRLRIKKETLLLSIEFEHEFNELKRGRKRRYVLWDNLENIVIAEVGLDRVFKAEAFNVGGVGRRLLLNIHGRTALHLSCVCL